MSDVLTRARQAMAAIAEGRRQLAAVADSVKDGAAALSTSDQQELNRMLEEEKAETRAAHASLEDALRSAGG